MGEFWLGAHDLQLVLGPEEALRLETPAEILHATVGKEVTGKAKYC